MSEFIKTAYNIITAAWRGLIDWMEKGDLVPVIVLVSVPHYIKVLALYDDSFSAAAVGFLVDFGAFRTVRLAVRYQGDNLTETALRWFFVTIMSIITLSYHMRFYNDDIALALPLPFLVVALAWLSQRDERSGGRKPAQVAPLMRQNAPDDAHDANVMRQNAPDKTHGKAHSKTNAADDANLLPYACKICGERCASPSAVASHVRWVHKEKKQ